MTGTLCFLTGVQGMGLEAVVGMQRDRRTREGQRLLNLRRQGGKVYLRGLAFPVWVSWYRYPLPKGKWAWRYVVATFSASGGTVPLWSKRRFSIEHFFKAIKSEFSLVQFGQRTPLEVHRFLVLCLLAYLLAHWVRIEQEGEGLTWREASRESLRLLLPGLVAQATLRELHAPGLGHSLPDEVRGKVSLCRLCRRCKF